MGGKGRRTDIDREEEEREEGGECERSDLISTGLMVSAMDFTT